MSNNIYSITFWVQNTQFFKNDIITNDNINFYYVSNDYLSSSSFQTDINNGNLIGYINYNGIQKPYFTWKSSYKYSNESVPRIRKIQLGDGYSQIASDGINNILMNITFPFTNIDINEYTAILHFLTTRKGVESFVFVPPPPFNIQKLFRCEKWNHSQIFFNNYEISAVFIETVF
jgi:phage-related protein